MHLLDENRQAYQSWYILSCQKKLNRWISSYSKSYLVNMHYIELFQYNRVQMRGGLCLTPSEKNYSELKQKYLQWRGKADGHFS